MVLYGVRLLINIFDMCIYRRCLEQYIGKRKTSNEVAILFIIVLSVIGSIVNQLGNPYLNFGMLVLILSVFISQYESKLLTKLVMPAVYLGLIFITEPLGYLIYIVTIQKYTVSAEVSYYFIGFIMELIRLLIVEVFCRLKEGKIFRISRLPREIAYILIVIPLISIISCILIIEIAKVLINTDLIILCMAVIFTVIVSNYLMFTMVHRYMMLMDLRREDELFQQEVAYKKEYYKDLREYTEHIQDMKHDMKNQLMTLYDSIGANEPARKMIKDIVTDIKELDESIFSTNPILNSIIKIKSSKARDLGIQFKSTIFMPHKISIVSGDMGVLYGNLLDNAIEACEQIEPDKRYINFETKYQAGKLIIAITNSKCAEVNPTFRTTKDDKKSHGRGLRSVERVANKYGGIPLLKDKGEEFEAKLLLTGIECLE